jgi:SAM-dependent methyltransferase
LRRNRGLPELFRGLRDCKRSAGVCASALRSRSPIAPALERFARLLRPGGVLAIVGLYRLRTFHDLAWPTAALPVSWWLRLTRNYVEVAAPIRDPDETLEEIRNAAARILPGAAITRRLLFRYSLVWRKP